MHPHPQGLAIHPPEVLEKADKQLHFYDSYSHMFPQKPTLWALARITL